jgi:redox-sensitive bicupin YhaK (pirin superfamily)
VGGRVHGFQIWVNLPARLKMTQPRYQEIASDAIPEARTEDGRARVRVIAGEALGVRAVIDTHVPIVYQDWTIDEGADVVVPIAREQHALAYVFEGAVRIGDRGEVVSDGQLAILSSGDAVRFRGEKGRLLLLAGEPIRERVVQYGPFVMNSDQEIAQAIRDFQSGKMGEITRTAKLS